MSTGPSNRSLLAHLGPSSRARVLLVEDDSELRDLLAEELRRDALVVIEAQSGIEALGHIGASLHAEPPVPFDLIVYDDEVGTGTAFDLLSALRFTDGCAPVVLLTATSDPERHHRARALGAAAVLDKPFAMRDLRTVVLNFTNGPWPRVA